jgi:hypothetical protein
MVEISLPFCCLDEVGWVRRVVWEVDGWCLEFPHGQRGKRTVKLEAVRNVFGDGFNIQIEGRCHLGGPSVVKNNMLQPLRGHHEQWFLWGEGAALESRCSFNFWFLLGLGWFGSCHAIVDEGNGYSVLLAVCSAICPASFWSRSANFYGAEHFGE